jgi:hypothetical protein
MASTAEKRKSTQAIVTPNSAKDADWRRQTIGIYSFGDDEVVPPPGPVSNPEMSYSVGFSIGF